MKDLTAREAAALGLRVSRFTRIGGAMRTLAAVRARRLVQDQHRQRRENDRREETHECKNV
ncbi:hypothetical protein WJ542_16290 [Paraburkholderia sp. B3]|uniref:hypothetical protein n=1 Tax=Paraburkholderia sp. B3 TaxID=3134791 RepID=UPI003982741F